MLKVKNCMAFLCLGVFSFAAQTIHSVAQSVPKSVEQPSVPSTAIGMLLSGFLDAINSSDAKQINSFVERHFSGNKIVKDAWPTPCCLQAQVSRTLANAARRSGGLILKEVHPHETDIVAFARTRRDGQRIYIDLQNSRETPDRIVGYQFVAEPADPEEFVPKVGDSTPLSQRIELARKALEKTAARDLFSGALLIARNGNVVLTAAYGEANKESHVANTLDTRFDIASMGKLFTTVAVAQLVAQGRLNYDEPILRYLPDYPNKTIASKITLRELLTHTSGLADIFSKGNPKVPLHHLQDYYPLFANDPLLFEPGKGQYYSNTGFLVASMIVEQVSGEEFREYLRHHIFEPAGMSHTGWGQPPARARPYAKDFGDDPLASDKPWVSAEPFYKDLLGGPAAGQGGEYSTVGDLLKFSTALQSGKLLNSKDFNVLIQEGYGCQCSAQPGQRIYSHGGGGPGIDTGFKLFVDQDSVSIFWSNYSPPFPQMLVARIEDLLLSPK